MQLGKTFISKIYRLYGRFIFGISFEITDHVHFPNESGDFQDIVKYTYEKVDEIVIMIECLFWGIDIQISRI